MMTRHRHMQMNFYSHQESDYLVHIRKFQQEHSLHW